MVYYHSSTIYSIFALSNTNESVVERYRHTAYGETTVLDADGSDDADGASDVGNPYLFQSRRWEPAAGVMQFRHREYAPVLGRFLQRDPLLRVGQIEFTDPSIMCHQQSGVPMYVFAAGSPRRYADPYGLDTADLLLCYAYAGYVYELCMDLVPPVLDHFICDKVYIGMIRKCMEEYADEEDEEPEQDAEVHPGQRRCLFECVRRGNTQEECYAWCGVSRALNVPNEQ